MKLAVACVFLAVTFLSCDACLPEKAKWSLHNHWQWRSLFDSLFSDPNIKKMPAPKLDRGKNGGFSCGACTVILGMAEQLSQVHNSTIPEALHLLCSYIPQTYRGACDLLARYVAPFIIQELDKHTSPDTLCYELQICYVESNTHMCHLFPLPSSINEVGNVRNNFDIPRQYLEESSADGNKWPWVCYIPGVWHLCIALDDVYDQLVPALDLDGDRFSPTETLRGSIWREQGLF